MRLQQGQLCLSSHPLSISILCQTPVLLIAGLGRMVARAAKLESIVLDALIRHAKALYLALKEKHTSTVPFFFCRCVR